MLSQHDTSLCSRVLDCFVLSVVGFLLLSMNAMVVPPEKKGFALVAVNNNEVGGNLACVYKIPSATEKHIFIYAREQLLATDTSFCASFCYGMVVPYHHKIEGWSRLSRGRKA